MGKRITNDFMIGLVVVTALGLLLALTYKVSKFSFVKRGYELKVAFINSSGIEENAPVRLSGVEAGKMAGDTATRAVQEGDVSATRLSEYERHFEEYWGKRIKDSRRVLEMLDKFSDENLNTLAKAVTHEDVLNLANGTAVAKTLTRIVARAPIGIMGLISAYIRG